MTVDQYRCNGRQIRQARKDNGANIANAISLFCGQTTLQLSGDLPMIFQRTAFPIGDWIHYRIDMILQSVVMVHASTSI